MKTFLHNFEEALKKDLSLSLDSGRIRIYEAPCGADAAVFRGSLTYTTASFPRRPLNATTIFSTTDAQTRAVEASLPPCNHTLLDEGWEKQPLRVTPLSVRICAGEYGSERFCFLRALSRKVEQTRWAGFF
jgi:hypothetical protein